MENFIVSEKILTQNEKERMEVQDSRLVSDHKAKLLESDARKYWDLFYKRNDTRFFRDRHWTTREFKELLNYPDITERKILFEIGCGVGNFIFPLIEEGFNFYIHACDFSPRAVQLIKSNKLYSEKTIHVFQADITTDHIHTEIESNSVDIATLIFILSAIHPDKFVTTIRNVFTVLKHGGTVLFRDYGLYDMSQLRFKAGNKISENFYMRQDGTRSFYFSTAFLESIFTEAGFETVSNMYINRRTVNKKENIDLPRIFIQGSFRKPLT